MFPWEYYAPPDPRADPANWAPQRDLHRTKRLRAGLPRRDDQHRVLPLAHHLRAGLHLSGVRQRIW